MHAQRVVLTLRPPPTPALSVVAPYHSPVVFFFFSRFTGWLSPELSPPRANRKHCLHYLSTYGVTNFHFPSPWKSGYTKLFFWGGDGGWWYCKTLLVPFIFCSLLKKKKSYLFIVPVPRFFSFSFADGEDTSSTARLFCVHYYLIT